MDFTQKTYEAILAELLSNIPGDQLSIEGSLIHAALAPAALEFADEYSYIKYVYEQISVATATSPILDNLTEQYGVSRLPPTYATRRGEFYDISGNLVDVPIGSRYSLDAVNFVVEERAGDGTYIMMSEESGKSGNYPVGQMQQLQFTDGVARAMVTDIIIAGEDRESDSALRERYYEYLANYAQDGNVNQYQKWVSQFSGIGRAKIIPLRNGTNTVKVSILDVDNKKASTALIKSFQDYLDPNSEGLGNGVAPIGAIVTVSTAAEKAINISANIEIVSGFALDTVKANVTDALTKYFSESSYKKSKVFYMDVGSAILGTEGVYAISDLRVNNGIIDIALEDEEIGKIGTLTITGV